MNLNCQFVIIKIIIYIYIYSYVYYQIKIKIKSSVSCAKSRDILKRLTTPPQRMVGGMELQILVLFVLSYRGTGRCLCCQMRDTGMRSKVG